MILETIGGECIVSHRRRRESPRKSRTRRPTPLFIDQLKSNFQNAEFVPPVKTHRNWCPKFLSKYLHDSRHDYDDDSRKPLRRTLSRSFVPETPEIFSIGLRDRGSKSMDDNSGICNAIRNLKRCLNSVSRQYRPSALPDESDSLERDAKKKLDFSVRSGSFKENDLDRLNVEGTKCRKHHHRHCHRHRCSHSANRMHSHRSCQHQDYSAEEVAAKKTVAVQASRRRKHRRSRKNRMSEIESDLRQKANKIISSEDGFKLIETTRALYDSVPTKYMFNSLQKLTTDEDGEQKENMYHEHLNSMLREPTGSKYLTIARSKSYTRMIEAKAAEIKVLEDIKRRIDKDFELKPSSDRKTDDYEDFVIPIPQQSSTEDDDVEETGEIELNARSCYYPDTCGEDSEEFVSCRSSPYEINPPTYPKIDYSKSLPVMPHLLARYKTNETELRETFSTHTFPEHSQTNICDPKYSLLRHFCSLSSIPAEITITSPAECREKIIEENASNGMTAMTNKPANYVWVPKLKNIIDSTDSGVLTDCSPNEMHESETFMAKKAVGQKNDYHCPVYAREIDSLPVFDFNSDSCSDGSLERRVDKAVRTFTENLVLCERRAKTKLKMLRKRRGTAGSKLAIDVFRQTSNSRCGDGRRDDFSRLSRWSSEDEKIPPLSTPSLSPFSDSEIENPTTRAATARETV